MAFGNYTELGEVLKELQVSEHGEEFIELAPVAIEDHFRSRIQFRLNNCPVRSSEASVCETLIYPVLEEILLPYAQEMVIWSHLSVSEQGRLLGVPDYILAKRSPLSPLVRETPYAACVEAKRNDFEVGWAQCLAAMHALQRLNAPPERTLYGIVSDGFVWRFGRLRGQSFVRHPGDFSLYRLDELFAGLNYVFRACKQEIAAPATAA